MTNHNMRDLTKQVKFAIANLKDLSYKPRLNKADMEELCFQRIRIEGLFGELLKLTGNQKRQVNRLLIYKGQKKRRLRAATKNGTIAATIRNLIQAGKLSDEKILALAEKVHGKKIHSSAIAYYRADLTARQHQLAL